MGLRHSLREKPAIAIGAVMMIGVAAMYNITRQRDAVTAGERWFFNVDTAELTRIATDQTPPIMLPNGHEGVWAHVYACGSCDETDQRIVAYLEKFADQPAAAPQTIGPENGPFEPSSGPADPTSRTLVATADNPAAWHSLATPQGMQVRNRIAHTDCPQGGRPEPCR
jgi:hypothetical protein